VITQHKYRFFMLKNLQNIFFLCLIIASSCKKEDTVYTDNTPKNYEDVPTVKVENYINRVYIDLLGREPLDNENIRDLELLRSENLSYEIRKTLIRRLMTDSSYVIGDSSYRKAYYQRLYNLSKARLLEGAGDEEFYQIIGNANFGVKSSRLKGDSIGVYAALSTIDRCQNVLKSRRAYQYEEIGIGEMYAYMLNNPVYDVINMNSLNFVNASFDDMFFRFPTKDEFAIAYKIIESGKGGSLFGGFSDNKASYCAMLVNSREFSEGMIKWCYLTLIGRDPTTQEYYNLMEDFHQSKDLQTVQESILATDEYAHF
jgi:hypothetical protein